ncbi:MAG: hypothetical protein ACREOG_02725 [Gemmatimonadaceae bacterium]
MTRARKPYSILPGAARLCIVLLSCGALSCEKAPRESVTARAPDSAAVAPDVAAVDSALDTLIAGSPEDTTIAARQRNTPRLTPLADSLTRFFVFVPITQRWFAAASRGQRMLVDIGRVDTTIGDNPVRQAAFKEAVAKLAPIGRGDRLRLRGPWGSDDVTVRGFDVWSGRIVATLDAPTHVDSLARERDWLPAVAVRSDSAQSSTSRACNTTIPPTLNSTLTRVKDSVVKVLRAAPDLPRITRLANSLKDASSRIGGCFENAAAIMLVTLYAGDYEWVRERAFAVDTLGGVRQVTVRDLRFKAHEMLGAFDADEDGDDDVAARGRVTRAGALVVLRLVDGPPVGCCARGAPPVPNVPASRLERAAAGFAWER